MIDDLKSLIEDQKKKEAEKRKNEELEKFDKLKYANMVKSEVIVNEIARLDATMHSFVKQAISAGEHSFSLKLSPELGAIFLSSCETNRRLNPPTSFNLPNGTKIANPVLALRSKYENTGILINSRYTPYSSAMDVDSPSTSEKYEMVVSW